MATGKTRPALSGALLVLGLSVATAQVHASDMPQPSLTVDLNALQQVETSCRLMFVATNGTENAIEEMALETVLFTSAGAVDRFALFDFKALPMGKTRVRQFDLPDTRCEGIGRVLINGVSACKGPSLKGGECAESLKFKSSSKTEIIG
jgi:hypothetical protein